MNDWAIIKNYLFTFYVKKLDCCGDKKFFEYSIWMKVFNLVFAQSTTQITSLNIYIILFQKLKFQ